MSAVESDEEFERVHDKCKHKYFQKTCPVCHEPVGNNEVAPELEDEVYRPGDDDGYQVPPSDAGSMEELEARIKEALERDRLEK